MLREILSKNTVSLFTFYAPRHEVSHDYPKSYRAGAPIVEKLSKHNVLDNRNTIARDLRSRPTTFWTIVRDLRYRTDNFETISSKEAISAHEYIILTVMLGKRCTLR